VAVISPGDLLVEAVSRSEAALGALVYAERQQDGKLVFNGMLAAKEGATEREILDSLEALAKTVMTHYQRMKANAASRIIQI